MPKLPSGLRFGVANLALFDHGGNWFDCPDGHFWYWVPDQKIMGPGPYEFDTEIIQNAEHAAVPKTHWEAKKFVQVLEFIDDHNYVWRGEWLDTFPKFRQMSEEDLLAWKEWVDGPLGQKFLDKTIGECGRLAVISGQRKK